MKADNTTPAEGLKIEQKIRTLEKRKRALQKKKASFKKVIFS